MKAMILAAGYGTRLLPLTKRLPKIMLTINKKPLLYYQLQWLKKYGIKEIAINLHYLAHKIRDYLEHSDFGLKINYSYEEKILGTAGGVKKLENFLKNDDFIVLYGDNLTNLNINHLLRFHRKTNGIATICLHKAEINSLTESSIVSLDNNSRIINFIEKPKLENILRNINLSKNIYSNAGIYILSPKIMRFIIKNKFSDFGRDIFPELISTGKAMFGYPINKYYWRELGTLKKYYSVRREVESKSLKNLFLQQFF